MFQAKSHEFEFCSYWGHLTAASTLSACECPEYLHSVVFTFQLRILIGHADTFAGKRFHFALENHAHMAIYAAQNVIYVMCTWLRDFLRTCNLIIFIYIDIYCVSALNGKIAVTNLEELTLYVDNNLVTSSYTGRSGESRNFSASPASVVAAFHAHITSNVRYPA